MPVEPPPSRWAFARPDDEDREDDDVVGVGADLEPGSLLAAYRHGIFPMPVGRKMAWWSPNPRGILPLDGLKISRSLRKSAARFEIRVDTAFTEVIAGCADPGRDGEWISKAIRSAYTELHRLGWVHSVESWSKETGELAGGLYGVAIGGLFAGESMFHRQTDASKVALIGLVDLLQEGPDGANPARLLDVQWVTPHLASLGAVEIPRLDYLDRVSAALELELPPAFSA
ncbi:MAG: leucyl/phenylalanyl-tRNA---protein transferase [Actinomycetota bacterium]|nr:leucyl/phenylalanyl-tRNA---protein transferase [Actinomycetota bacterium]